MNAERGALRSAATTPTRRRGRRRSVASSLAAGNGAPQAAWRRFAPSRRTPGIAALILLLGLLASAAYADLVAADNADNDPYPLGWNPGDNGGFGFTAWVNLEVGTPGAMYVEDEEALDGQYSWGLSDYYAVGRGLSNSLAVGQWTFLARHGSDVDLFCGFNLRTSTSTEAFETGEILRFGVNYSNEFNATRIYFSTNAGESYAYLDVGDDDLRGTNLEYSVSWSTISGSFTLGVRNGETYAEVTADLPSGSPVAMLGAGIFEMNLDAEDHITFDDYGVSAIPEPGVAVTLVLGVWLLRGVFRRRTRA